MDVVFFGKVFINKMNIDDSYPTCTKVCIAEYECSNCNNKSKFQYRRCADLSNTLSITESIASELRIQKQLENTNQYAQVKILSQIDCDSQNFNCAAILSMDVNDDQSASTYAPITSPPSDLSWVGSGSADARSGVTDNTPAAASPHPFGFISEMADAIRGAAPAPAD